jgi:ATP-dependent DNA helicase RecG
MKPSLQKLHKFLKLEAERGYDNRAVVGGLDRMLPNWEAEARLEGLPEEFIQVVGARLRDYPRLSPSSRAETLEGLWRRIQREANTTLPPLSPAPQTPESRPEPAPEARPAQRHKAEEPAYSAPVESAGRQPLHEAGELETSPETEEGGARPAEPLAVQEPEEDGPVPQADQDSRLEPALPAAPKPVLPVSRAVPEGPPAALNAPTTVLPGVGPRHAQTLKRLNLSTLGDMLYYFPRRYDDYSKLRPINRLFYGDEVTVIGTVQSAGARPIRSGRVQIVEAVVSDGSGALRITWFNQPWIAKRLRNGMHVVLSGKIDQYLGRLVMNNPEWEPLEQQNLHTNRIVPVYPLTASITQRWLRTLMFQVVSYWSPRVQDPLPLWVRREAGLLDLSTALLQSHFPDSAELLKAARQRLAFDEVLLLQLGVLRQKHAWQDRRARLFETPDSWLEAQVSRLPFPLTGAQRRALADVQADLASGRPMNRLLQGDVGSGKTVIAALGIAMIVQAGAQAAVLAPTSILAEQHYRNLATLLSGVPAGAPAAAPAEAGAGEAAAGAVNGDAQADSPRPDTSGAPALSPAVLRPEEIALLVGATPEAEKRQLRERLAAGEIKLVIGTHALLEDPVNFLDLQLVVIDEQHRFGVEQRALLRAKGDNPHLRVMTATPIPRSLALTIYGDLDLSVMDEMPPGRQVVDTHVLYPRERERAYSLIRSQVDQGRQAFIIYPLVEESETSEALAAVEEFQRLQSAIFPNCKLGLLHGRMKPDEKDEVMARFRDKEIQILVSTSVVEVGVDIPNATVMVIEGANRFGLAQLHQFRGRVGRGSEKAYCILIPDTPDEVENQRLAAMVETNDGFVLAERDLEQRGPGQFLGTRQSGYSELRLASLTDVRMIEKARRLAQMLFEQDPELQKSEHRLLSHTLQRFWGEATNGQPGQGDIS